MSAATKFHIITPNSTPDTCAKCENVCCERLPGALHPEQLPKVNVVAIEELLVSGLWVADWWEGTLSRSHEPYYIRPRQTEEAISLYRFGAWGSSAEGVCVFLNSLGCSLPFTKRPYECQNLVANQEEPGRCGKGVHDCDGKEGMFLAWVPYQTSIRAALRRMEKKGQ